MGGRGDRIEGWTEDGHAYLLSDGAEVRHDLAAAIYLRSANSEYMWHGSVGVNGTVL